MLDNNFNNFEQQSDNNQQDNTSNLNNNITNIPDDAPNTYSPNSDSTDNIASDNSSVNLSDNQTGYNDYVDISSNQNIENNQEQIQYYPRPEEYKWNYQQQNSHYDQNNQHNNFQYGQYNQSHNSQYGYNYNNQSNQNTQGYQYSPPQYNNYYNMKDTEKKEQPRQGMAIASMVLGICGVILSFCCCCIPIYGSFASIAVSGIGLVLAILALSAGNRSGFAVSGIITSLIGVLISAALLIILYTGIMGLNEFQSMVNGGYNPFM